MVDPVISNAVGKGLDSVAKQPETSPAKVGESKFDQVRSRLLEDQAAQVKLPPEVKQISPEQQKVLHADLTRQLNSPGGAQEVFGVRMKRAKEQIHQLNTRVSALPKTPAFEPLRERLASIDKQYQSAGKLVNAIHGSTNPADFMKVQMQMYQLSENVELMSKVVEQVTSGVKSILQTQL
jgi:tetrahydromethanopterin S-methyltransferase subunit B